MPHDEHANMRFARIDGIHRRADGHVVRRSWSRPSGFGMKEYDRMVANMFGSFGSIGTTVYGIPMPGPEPLPCIVCGRRLNAAMDAVGSSHVPYAGTMFETGGHYGSTAFDPLDGTRLQIVVCDECLTTSGRVRIQTADGRMAPWNGVDDTMPPEPVS